MRIRNGFMSLAAALLLTGPAAFPVWAQTTPPAAPAAPAPDHENHFAKLDTNGDGFIDKSEARGRLAEHFDEIDTDHDGRLSRDELKAAWAAHRGMKGDKAEKHGDKAGHLAMLDTDHDGRISWAEFSAGIKAHFDQLDTNHDGYLDANELRAAHRHGGKHGHGKDVGGKDAAPSGTWGGQQPGPATLTK
ncbi:EF-hand domain-containing protein [Asticcacaulis solisilvae]|uniref:EF-hand domain-containing protein n=1 Tax=Asticcacaulis solisilvae TaxID=1217274 RepID=UPI003FD8A622